MLLLLSAGVFNNVFGSLQVSVLKMKDSDNYALNITNEKLSSIKVHITEQSGEILFTEVFHSVEKFYKVYNLSSLPKGVYFIKVTNDESSVKKEINVNQLKRTHPDLGINMLVGFSGYKDNKITVVVQNKGRRNIELGLYGANGEELNIIKKTNDPMLKQIVDFSDLQPGEYKLKISDRRSVYCKVLTVI